MTPEDLAAFRDAASSRSRKLALQNCLDEMAGGGLARIAKHMNRPFATISAFSGQSKVEDLKATEGLAKDLIALRAGGLKMQGFYAPTNSHEISFFVPMPRGMELSEFRETMIALGEKYGQHSVGLSDGKRYSFWKMEGGVEYVGNIASLTSKKIEEFWSKRHGKKFVISKKGDPDTPHYFDHTKAK